MYRTKTSKGFRHGLSIREHFLTGMSEHEHNGGVGSLGLGIDVGSTNTKVALVDLERAGVLQVRAAVTPDDALRLVDTVLRLVRTSSASRAMPAVVGIASMAETGVPLDLQGAPLTTLLRWNEARGTAVADALVASLGRESPFAATGVQPGPKAPLATWAWLRHTHPEVWVSMYRWAGVSELIALALTGEFATDHTLAGRTMAYLLPDGAGLPAASTPTCWMRSDCARNNCPECGTRRIRRPGHPRSIRAQRPEFWNTRLHRGARSCRWQLGGWGAASG